MANINSNDYFKGKRLQTIYQIYKERTSEKKSLQSWKDEFNGNTSKVRIALIRKIRGQTVSKDFASKGVRSLVDRNKYKGIHFDSLLKQAKGKGIDVGSEKSLISTYGSKRRARTALMKAIELGELPKTKK